MAMRLFLVDDDPDDQEIFDMALQSIDSAIQCTVANDGLEALQKLQSDTSFQPDYIFLDVNMPRMNGVECLKQIRKMKLAEHSCIVMYSTTLDDRVMEESKQSGVKDFMTKPSTLTALKDKLRKQLSLTDRRNGIG
jgi:CheY-like chemotaxis protein